MFCICYLSVIFISFSCYTIFFNYNVLSIYETSFDFVSLAWYIGTKVKIYYWIKCTWFCIAVKITNASTYISSRVTIEWCRWLYAFTLIRLCIPAHPACLIYYLLIIDYCKLINSYHSNDSYCHISTVYNNIRLGFEIYHYLFIKPLLSFKPFFKRLVQCNTYYIPSSFYYSIV